ncbi:MAG: hypothetical protein HY303_10910, partial [Candidatus Wallbacteria bacterium]|nr:hypothetical protein [Candidatus Wallbacteria bacterium]
MTNLAAVSVEADRSVSIGNTLHVTGTVRNDGPGSVQGAALAFVLTHGEEPGLSSPLLGPPVALPAMAANETKAVRAAYSVAPWVAPGSYSVAMLVDPGDFIPETNETDNVSASALGVTISAPLSPALLPDLTVEQVSPAPTGPSRRFAGGTAALVGSVRNRGGGDAALPFSTRFFLVKDPASGPDAGLTLGSAAVSSLASGQAAIVSGSFPLPLLPPGDYFLGLAVDSEGRVPDGNSRNNVLVSADRFTISTPPLLAAAPNVSVASISAASGAAVATTFSARVGIAATGAPAALPVDVLLLLTRGSQVPSAGDIAVGRGTVVVPAGGMATAALTAFVRPGTPAGTYSLAAIADPQQLLPDPDRRDNVLVVSVSSFAVASGPALLDDYLPPAGQPVPSSLPEPQRITPGGPPILGLIEAAGDRDAFFFDLAAPGGNLQAELAARGSEDLSLEAIGPGGTRSSGISGGGGQPCRLFNFPATSPGRYVLVASHRTASGTGGYALSARLTAGVTAVVDLLPGAISVAPIAPTTRDGIAMRWSIANAGPTTSGTFAWDLRLVPQDCTLCAGGQGEAAALDLASGRLARLPGRSSVDLGPISTGPLPAGKYRVVLSIDTQAEVSEAIESNNTREIPLEVLPARRTEGLAVAALAVEPFQPTTATSRVVALGAVSNRGSERTTRFDIQFVLDRTSVARGSIVTRFFIEGLPPASRLALRPVPLPVLVQGAHTLTLELDPDGRLAQSNPDEGRLTIGFGVGPNRVSGFDLATGLVSVEPAAPTTRDALVLSGVVFNRGDAASSEVSLRAVLDGVTVATGVRVASIPAGGTATLPALPLSSGARAGAHRLTVSVAPVAGSEANPFDNETSLVFGVAEAVRSTRTLACSGVVSDAFGQAPPAGTRVRVLNRSRGLATARS